MTAFEKFWETVARRFPSDTSAYFAKPLLAEAFKAGRDHERARIKAKEPAEV